MNTVLSVRNLSYEYQGKKILNGVNLSLVPGSLLVLCGLSGQGKSTFLRLLMGLEKPSGGDVVIFGENIHHMRPRDFNALKSRIGFVFQNSALISTMTVEQNLRLPLVYHQMAKLEDIDKRVNQTLDMLLIKEYRNYYPSELSIGLQKRAAMARAIITQPEIILMDEPTSGLDNISRSLLMALIENIRMVQSVPMLMVTHDLLLARSMRAPIGVLKDGEILEPMAYDQLKNSPDHFVKDMLAEMNG